MIKILLIYCVCSLTFLNMTIVWSADLCDPVVKPLNTETMISQQLSLLAEKYNFSLSFPQSLDRPMLVDESMELSQLVKLLTSQLNTVLNHEQVKNCNSLRLTDLIVISTGEESSFISVSRDSRAQPTSYIYIDDMETYVTEVLLHKRKAEKRKMTPQQLAEYKMLRKKLKKELESEIKEAKNKKDKSSGRNHKRNKKINK